jgi:hypothetical protein
VGTIRGRFAFSNDWVEAFLSLIFKWKLAYQQYEIDGFSATFRYICSLSHLVLPKQFIADRSLGLSIVSLFHVFIGLPSGDARGDLKESI